MGRPVEKKLDIENAAIRLFATKGLARTTIKDIAGEAGVTEGALYRHYAGKNEMAWQLFCQELELFSSELGTKMFEAGASVVQRLEQSVRFIFSYYRKKPVQFAFIMLTQHGFPEEKILDEDANPNDMAERFVAAGIKAGNIPAMNPALTAGLVLGLVLQTLVMHRYDRLDMTDEVVGEVVEAAKRVLQLN